MTRRLVGGIVILLLLAVVVWFFWPQLEALRAKINPAPTPAQQQAFNAPATATLPGVPQPDAIDTAGMRAEVEQIAAHIQGIIDGLRTDDTNLRDQLNAALTEIRGRLDNQDLDLTTFVTQMHDALAGVQNQLSELGQRADQAITRDEAEDIFQPLLNLVNVQTHSEPAPAGIIRVSQMVVAGTQPVTILDDSASGVHTSLAGTQATQEVVATGGNGGTQAAQGCQQTIDLAGAQVTVGNVAEGATVNIGVANCNLNQETYAPLPRPRPEPPPVVHTTPAPTPAPAPPRVSTPAPAPVNNQCWLYVEARRSASSTAPIEQNTIRHSIEMYVKVDNQEVSGSRASVQGAGVLYVPCNAVDHGTVKVCFGTTGEAQLFSVQMMDRAERRVGALNSAGDPIWYATNP